MEEEIQVNVEEFFSDGYERLYDETMDESVHKECEKTLESEFHNGLIRGIEMKISLSQEQLKLNCNKNFLTVPANTKKKRSLSFSIENSTCVERLAKEISLNSENSQIRSQSVNEIVYSVPKKPQKVSSAALHDDDDAILPLSPSPEVNIKYPLMFYCKMCNNILNDPRTLNCLHTFCLECLCSLDTSNESQHNQSWGKISDSSSCRFN